MKRLVEKLAAGGTPATRHLQELNLIELANRIYGRARNRGLSCILNRVQDDEVERIVRERSAEPRITPIGVIAASWLDASRLPDWKRSPRSHAR